ncbi:MAG: hypothetical protein ONB05_10945, partial [candidate division KSB1 bacterium]|nr:hypothetical protein [candidate division KSB1 bacterium]
LAGASEVAQISTSRDADFRALFFNLVGIFLTHGALFLWRNQTLRLLPSLTIKILRSFFLLIILSTLLPAGLNLAGIAICQHQGQQMAPHLAHFEEKWELFRWQESSHTDISLSSDFHSEGHRSLKVTCYPSAYPGVTLNDPPRDWTGYKFLSFEIFNPQDQIITLFVRLDYGKPENRFYFTCILQPGINLIQLSLESVFGSPQNASFNLTKVIFFLFQPAQVTCFYLDNVRLE